MSTRKSLAFSFLDRYASLVVGIVSSMVLARLLTPSELGLFSIAMALLALVASVRDLGAGQYLLQEKNLTPDRIRAVWTVQLGLGLALACLVALSSGPVAGFYREPGMAHVMLVLALTYAVNPLGSVTYAWLMREMRYDAVAVMRFSATTASAATSIALASRGFGAISLAWGALCGTVVNALVSVAFRPRGYPWLPGMREIGRVVSFGGKLVTGSVFNTVAVGTPEFLLGKLQSLAAAGFYSRANGLVALFNRLVTDAIVPVTMSLFSRESRESRNTGPIFVTAASHIAALSWSFSLGLIFLAQPAIRLLYGTQWNESVELARLLAGAMAFASLVPLCSAALIGVGAADKVLGANAGSAAAMIALAALGAPYGLLFLGWMLLIAAAITAAIWLILARKALGFHWFDLWLGARKSLVVACLSTLFPALAWVLFDARPEQIAAPLALGVSGGAVGFLLGVRWSNHPVGAEIRRLVPGAWLRTSGRRRP